MDIGIGLPNAIDARGSDIVRWARRAEERGFSTLGTIDRIVYPTYDSLTTLAVAAGATTRIRLMSNVLLTPLYPPVWLAKAAASLDAMSDGRLTLGLGVGARRDDFAAMHQPFERRGRTMDDALDLFHRAWAQENVTGGEFPVCPAPAYGNRVPILIGGTSSAAVRRTIRYAEGWTAGGLPPAAVRSMSERIRAEWQTAGREDEPRIAALVYVGLGDETVSRASLRRYYGFAGDMVDAIVDGAIRTPEAAREQVRAYAAIGVTELHFFPSIPSLDEVDRLADAVL